MNSASFHAVTLAFVVNALYAEGALVAVRGDGYNAGFTVMSPAGRKVTFSYRHDPAALSCEDVRWTRLDWEVIPGMQAPGYRETRSSREPWSRPTAGAGKKLLAWVRKQVREFDERADAHEASVRRDRESRATAARFVSEATGVPVGGEFSLRVAGEVVGAGRYSDTHTVNSGSIHLDLGVLSGERLVRVMSALRAAGVLEVTEVVDAVEVAS